MDSIISSALEEICFHGEAGVSLPTLWSTLKPSLVDSNLDLDPGVKQALWTGLLGVPYLRFHGQSAGFTITPSDPSLQSFEAAENLNVKIVAEERLRDNFLGLYNPYSVNAALPSAQRLALQRLAVGRKDGITQALKETNLLYTVKNLEC